MSHAVVRTLPAADLDHVLQRTEGLWDELRQARLFVSGGTGFFGTWLLESFLHAVRVHGLGATAVVLTRDPRAFSRRSPHLAGHPAVTLLTGDVRNFPFDSSVLGFSHVLHVATPSVAPEDLYPPLELLEIIVAGTWRMLELARRCGARRFLLTSSGAVYGRQPPETTHLDEDYPGAPHLLDPGSAYAQGKRLAEHLCGQYHRQHGLHCTIARGFAFVGPHLPLDAHYAIGNFLRDGLAGGPVVVQGDGTTYRSYLHAADLATWLWTILLRGRPCRPYNVGAEEGLPLAEVARRVAACCDTEVIIRRAPAPGQPPARYVPSTRRAREELGLQAHLALDEAIAHTVRWYR